MYQNYANTSQTYNVGDSTISLSLTLNGSSVYTQGIFFRENDEMGIIIPKNDIFLEFDKDIVITIWGRYFLQELEFEISPKTYIGATEHLMYIPIKDLKVINNEITHVNKVYNKSILSNIRYCMKSNFIFFNQANTNFRYVTYTYLKGFSKTPLENRFLNFLGVTESGQQIISTLDVQMFNGSPIVIEILDVLGNTTTTSNIDGILIVASKENGKLISHNIGIFVSRNEILDLLNNTL